MVSQATVHRCIDAAVFAPAMSMMRVACAGRAAGEHGVLVGAPGAVDCRPLIVARIQPVPAE